jgi:hypothetical protein
MTSTLIEGTVKNGTDQQDNVRFIIGSPLHPFFNQTLDGRGHFELEGIGQGNHKVIVYSKSDGNTYADSFFISVGTIEKKKMDFNIGNWSKYSFQSITNNSDPNVNNSAFESESNTTQGEIQENFSCTTLEPAKNTSITNDNCTARLSQVSIKSGGIQNPYSTSVSVNASAKVLSEIDKVVYYLHPTFKPNVIPVSTKENNFGISFNNWGIFNLNAKVYFKGGPVLDLLLPWDKWKIS